jgi:acetoin utilization protein AcuB
MTQVMAAARDTVAAWMNTRPRRVDVDTRVGDLRKLMLAEGFQHALVIELGAVVGVISDHEVVAAVSPGADSRYATSHERASLEKRAHQIMGRSPLTTVTDTSMVDAATTLLVHRIHCLPVFFRRRCVGILTTSDVLRWALELAVETARAQAAAGSR